MKKIFIGILLVVYIAIFIVFPNLREFLVYPLVALLLILPFALEIKNRLQRKKELKKRTLENIDTNMEFSIYYTNFVSKQEEAKRLQRIEFIRIFAEIFVLLLSYISIMILDSSGLEELYSGIFAILVFAIIFFENKNFKYENKLKNIFFEAQNAEFLNLKFNTKPYKTKINIQQYLPDENCHVTNYKNHFVGTTKNSIPIEFLQFETVVYETIPSTSIPVSHSVHHDWNYTVLIRIDKDLSTDNSTSFNLYSCDYNNENHESKNIYEEQIVDLLNKYKKEHFIDFKIYIGNKITIKFSTDEEILKANLIGEPINKISIYNFYIITNFIKELLDILENT